MTLNISIIDDTEVFSGIGAGAPVFTINVFPRLNKIFNITYFPTSLSIARIQNYNDAKKLLEQLEKFEKISGLYIPENIKFFIEKKIYNLNFCQKVKNYLNLIKNESKETDLFLSPDYGVSNFIKITSSIKLLQCEPSLFLGDVYYFAKKLKKKAIAVILGLGDYPSDFIGQNAISYIKSLSGSNINIFLFFKWFVRDILANFYRNALLSDVFINVLFVSKGAMENLKLTNCKRCNVLNPALATDPKIMQYRELSKGNYVVASSRLVTNKGILEIPHIYKKIKEKTGFKLIITGRFDDEWTKKSFLGTVERLGLKDDIEIKGWLAEEEYYKTIAKAKVLIYPSHSDTFSLVILNSLMAGTPVVAYDIPGPKSVYGDLPSVKFVKEFDKNSMAEEAIKLIRLNENDYKKIIDDQKVNSFLYNHSSWDLVTKNVAENIENTYI